MAWHAKHHVEPQELPGLLIKLRAELEDLENTGVALHELDEQLRILHDAYNRQAAQLSNLRRQAAAELGGKSPGLCANWGCRRNFAIEIHSDPKRVSANGIDRAEFQVSANKGQPLRPMVKVASGVSCHASPWQSR